MPPQATTKGLAAGKSTVGAPLALPSDEPSSPDAARTLTPIIDASWHAELSAFRDCSVQEFSGPPQLIEMIEGFSVSVVHGRGDGVDESLIRVRREIRGDLRGGRNRSSHFDIEFHLAIGAARIAGGRIRAAVNGNCGDFWSGDSKAAKNESRSAAWYPPPNSITAMHWPAPFARKGN